MADADGDLPPLFQLVGPRFRRGEARDNAVTVGAAPSRPILRASVLNDEGEESKQQCRFQCLMIEHSLIIFQLLSFSRNFTRSQAKTSSSSPQFQPISLTSFLMWRNMRLLITHLHHTCRVWLFGNDGLPYGINVLCRFS